MTQVEVRGGKVWCAMHHDHEMVVDKCAFLVSPDGIHARQAECLDAEEVEELLIQGWRIEFDGGDR